MRKVADAALGTVAEADRVHRGEIARLAFAQEPFGDGRDQRVGNGVSGAGAADEQRVAAGDEPRRFIGCDDARRHVRTLRPRRRACA